MTEEIKKRICELKQQKAVIETELDSLERVYNTHLLDQIMTIRECREIKSIVRHKVMVHPTAQLMKNVFKFILDKEVEKGIEFYSNVGNAKTTVYTYDKATYSLDTLTLRQTWDDGFCLTEEIPVDLYNEIQRAIRGIGIDRLPPYMKLMTNMSNAYKEKLLARRREIDRQNQLNKSVGDIMKDVIKRGIRRGTNPQHITEMWGVEYLQKLVFLLSLPAVCGGDIITEYRKKEEKRIMSNYTQYFTTKTGKEVSTRKTKVEFIVDVWNQRFCSFQLTGKDQNNEKINFDDKLIRNVFLELDYWFAHKSGIKSSKSKFIDAFWAERQEQYLWE